jgi:hypothetical protein
MKRDFIITAHDGTEIFFRVFNRTPRRNQYERGMIYGLEVQDKRTGEYYPTGRTYSTIKAAREDARKDYFVWL